MFTLKFRTPPIGVNIIQSLITQWAATADVDVSFDRDKPFLATFYCSKKYASVVHKGIGYVADGLFNECAGIYPDFLQKNGLYLPDKKLIIP